MLVGDSPRQAFTFTCLEKLHVQLDEQPNFSVTIIIVCRMCISNTYPMEIEGGVGWAGGGGADSVSVYITVLYVAKTFTFLVLVLGWGTAQHSY